jgi:hypothetical protein
LKRGELAWPNARAKRLNPTRFRAISGSASPRISARKRPRGFIATCSNGFRKAWSNGTRPRHLRCILYLARGDEDRLAQYIALCLQDTRDVMLAAEYETDSKSKLVRKRDFTKPFGKR